MSAQVGRLSTQITGVFFTKTAKTLDVSQQVALVQPVPQDSCGFLDGANVKQKRTCVCDDSHSKYGGNRFSFL